MADEVKTTEQPEVLEGKMAEFATWLETITVMDLLKLVKALEKKFGVSAAVPTAAMAAGAATAPGAQAAGKKEEEQTEFTVILSEIGPQKIQVIKEIRAITGLGLQESKALVEGAPKPVKEGVSKEEALKLKEKLEAAGAKAEIK